MTIMTTRPASDLCESAKESRQLFKDSALQESFLKNGYVVVDFLNADEVAALSNAYGNLQGDLGNPAFASTIMSKDSEYRMAVSDAIETVFERAIRDLFVDVRFFWGNFNTKYPSEKGIVPLHQDPSFLDERQYNPLGLWVPLVDTDAENGALQVIAGSHTILKQLRCGARPFPYGSVQDSLLAEFGTSLFMKAGQAYIGSPALFHASPPNRSPLPRIVAAGLAGPAESGLRYHHYQAAAGQNTIEAFQVDKDYFQSAPLFSRPNEAQYAIMETLNYQENVPTTEELFEILKEFNKNRQY
jgi:hypothetical protein